MKKAVRILLLCTLALCAILTCACKPKTDNNTMGVVTNADGSPSIIGAWNAPDPINKDFGELWVFDADGHGYHLYQVDADFNVIKAIDGSYELKDGGVLDVTMMGHTLTYTYALTDQNTLILSDHGSDATYTRHTGAINK